MLIVQIAVNDRIYRDPNAFPVTMVIVGDSVLNDMCVIMHCTVMPYTVQHIHCCEWTSSISLSFKLLRVDIVYLTFI